MGLLRLNEDTPPPVGRFSLEASFADNGERCKRRFEGGYASNAGANLFARILGVSRGLGPLPPPVFLRARLFGVGLI